MKKAFLPVLLMLAGCQPIHAVGTADPSPVLAHASEVAARAATEDGGTGCAGAWFRHPDPNEFPPESDPWVIWLKTAPVDPMTPAYTYQVMWVNGNANPAPTITVTPFAKKVKVDGACSGCAQFIANITATTAGDCSTRTVLFPMDHSGGQ